MKRVLTFNGIVFVIALIACHQEPEIIGTYLAVSSTPQGADVYIDDSLTEYQTNCVIPDIEPGEYKISLKLYDFPEWSTLVKVEENDTTKVDAVLAINEGTIKWVYPIGDYYRGYQPAIGPDGTVYLYKGDLTALNPNGTVKWVYSATGGSKWATIGSDGTIYIEQNEHETAKICALTSSGSLKWEFQIDSIRAVSTAFAIGAEGTIYFAIDNYLFSLPKSWLYSLTYDGALKWKKEITYPGTPVIGVDGTVYVGGGKYLFAFSSGGNLKWAFQRGTTPPAIGSDGTLYFSSGDDFCALSPNGILKWRYQSSGTFNAPSLGSDGCIYVTNTIWEWEEDEWGEEWLCPVDAYLYCFSSSGNVLWKSDLAQWSRSTPAIGSDGSIYATTFEVISHKEIQSLYAFDSEGKFKWKCDGPSTTCSPAIGNDGTVYVYGYSKFYAIQTTSFGLADSPWPKYMHDNQNTGRWGGP
jgi:hypothetical protein